MNKAYSKRKIAVYNDIESLLQQGHTYEYIAGHIADEFYSWAKSGAGGRTPSLAQYMLQKASTHAKKRRLMKQMQVVIASGGAYVSLACMIV